MSTGRVLWVAFAVGVVGILTPACSSSASGAAESAGSGGSGGTTLITGGSAGMGGISGAGGVSAAGGTGGATTGAGGGAGSLINADFNCNTYCATAETKCSLDQASVEQCRSDCEVMYATKCGGSGWWYGVMKCGTADTAWICDQGKAALTGCQTERGYYTECMNSELCAVAAGAVATKCSLSSSAKMLTQIDCENRLKAIDSSKPLCKGLAVTGWMCAADSANWVCNGTTSATRTGCTAEAAELSACLTAGGPDAGAGTVTCGSYEPCCELCDTQCTGSSGTHIDSYKQCLNQCIMCCSSCDL
jgi:hypothetical protein